MVVAAGGMAARSALLAMLTNVFEPLLCQDLSRCTGACGKRSVAHDCLVSLLYSPCAPTVAVCRHIHGTDFWRVY